MVIKPPDLKHIKLKEQQGTQNVIDIDSWSGEALGIGVILDDLERICAFERVGPRFSNTILQAIKQLVRRKPPDPQRRIFIIATCCQPILHSLALRDYFDAVKRVPNVKGGGSLGRIIESLDLRCDPRVLQEIEAVYKSSLPVKRLIAMLGFCCNDDGVVTLEAFEKEYLGLDDDFVLEL